MDLFPESRICLTGGAVATRSAPRADCRQRLHALPWPELSALKHSLSIYLLEHSPRSTLIAININLMENSADLAASYAQHERYADAPEKRRIMRAG
jgi:hypothetical protein